jgi:Subtilase family
MVRMTIGGNGLIRFGMGLLLLSLSATLADARDGEREPREPRVEREPRLDHPSDIRFNDERASDNRVSDNRADAIADKAAQDAARSEERAARDAAKFAEERVKIESRAAADIAKDPARAAEAEAKAAEDLAKLSADEAEAEAKAAEDAAKDQADLAEDLAKAAEDAIKEDNSGSGSGSDDASDRISAGNSSELRDLATAENPEFDDRGFPARRGEIVALDLRADSLKRAEAQGFRLIAETRLPAIGASVTRLAVPDGKSASDALTAMRQIDPDASFDYTHYYGLNTGVAGTVERKGASRATGAAKGGNFAIGMIDTAVAPHRMLSSVTLIARPDDGRIAGAPPGHGTAVASILANEGASVIHSANVFRGAGAKIFTSADAITSALEWMVAKNVPVINISLAGPRNFVLDGLIRRVIASGHVIVAAAGNGGPSAPPAYPAAVPDVIAVTAVDDDGNIYRYANRGPYIAVAARGVAVRAAAPGGKTEIVSGTSFATPHIAAYLARCVGKNPATTHSQCIRRMVQNARDMGAPGRDPVYGFGVVD